ncbi:unnamed protein product [Orchesella dallaii]|uniref:Uncharacterized protein n=1 Tax=Orchesella dallaii TaxID=48710 RepID=A0ABP1Q146_9HEXA
MHYKVTPIQLCIIAVSLVITSSTPTLAVFAHNSLTAHQTPITITDRPPIARVISLISPTTEPPIPRYDPNPTPTQTTAPPVRVQSLVPHYPAPPETLPSQEESSEYDSSDYFDSYMVEDYQSEEDACARGQFYHVRGRQCVPIRCPKANHLRNYKTGQCLFSSEETEIKSFGRNIDGRVGYKNRNVLKSYRKHIGRGRTVQRWGISSQRMRVPVYTDTANPVRTVGLIG